METVNINPVSGDKGRYEKRKALDMVPVQMGQKNIIYSRSPANRLHDMIPEIPQPGTGVAEDIFIAAPDFKARRIPAVAAPDGKGKLFVKETLHISVTAETVLGSRFYCRYNFGTHLFCV